MPEPDYSDQPEMSCQSDVWFCATAGTWKWDLKSAVPITCLHDPEIIHEPNCDGTCAAQLRMDCYIRAGRVIGEVKVSVLSLADEAEPIDSAESKCLTLPDKIWKEALDIIHLTPLGIDAADMKLKIIKAIAKKHAESQGEEDA